MSVSIFNFRLLHIETFFFLFFFFLLSFVFIFQSHHGACGILVLRPGVEPVPPALEMQSIKHWTTREVP